MIGRLVEQEQVGLADEQLGQGEPGALSAGEGLDVLLPGLGAEADAQQRGLEPVPPGVAAGQVELVLDRLILLEHFLQRLAGVIGHRVLDVAEAVGELVQLRRRRARPRR